jgi:hypothetical protein
MWIIKRLLARACIPLCFIQLLKLETGQLSGSIDNLFLHLLLAFTTVWVGEIAYSLQQSNSNSMDEFISGSFFISILFLVLSLSRDLIHEEYGAKKYLMIDCGLPYLNLNQLLQWTCFEIWNLVFFIYSYLSILGVSTIKIVSYLFYLAMHAVVVIFFGLSLYCINCRGIPTVI